MKTITFIIAIIFCALNSKSQNENTRPCVVNDCYEIKVSENRKKLTPVYFNFRKRQLRDVNRNTISPIEFLNLCRMINDSAIQMQVAIYDSYSRDKQRLGVVALGSGFAALGLIGSSLASAGQGNDVMSGSLAFFGAVSILVIPAVAIYSTVPHQKRKGVLFRDLPIVYNHYVDTH